MDSRPDERRNELSKPFRRQRLKVMSACQACRLRKIKCDGGRPVCNRCQVRGKACAYSQGSVPLEQQTQHPPPVNQESAPPKHYHKPILPTPVFPSPSTVEDHSSEPSSISATPIATPATSQDSEPESDQNRVCYAAHGRFAGEVAAAIDVRAGVVPATTSNLVPFVDAPLFGEIDLLNPQLRFGYTLPPREYADRLIDIYWQYIDPVEPVLDRERFSQDYEAVYAGSGALPHADRDTWLCIFNIVIALAVQRQESIPLEKRDAEASHYFQRAWALLRPEVILWKPGSIELVQSLMLMNRYLHCTNNQQKTWMTAGLAVRIAQGMCCHLPESLSAKDSSSDAKLKHRVWVSCVALDRCVSWSLGRTSVPSLVHLPMKTNSPVASGTSHIGAAHADKLRRKMELHEIGNQIQLAQTQTRNGLASGLGLPRLYQHDDYISVAVQLDSCLSKWEKGLPDEWQLQSLPQVTDRASRAEGYLLQLRLLHSRIFLFRPMLARFYSMKPQQVIFQAASSTPSLIDRLLKDSSAMCIEAAQKIAFLINQTLTPPTESISLLPWWYRVYYLHIAGTIFLAAMFASDLYTPSVSDSWSIVLSTLRAHTHLSAYVQQCVHTFETLSARILQTKFPSSNSCNVEMPLDGTSGFSFGDLFEDVGFDFDTFVFGMEDFPES
ncbi:unnamed protein product [Clonostachys rosea f. rosea IK726]|uniref:Zn(2)-C6 fungal-type domain-containing protein n=2 Tax=Bionectria ochroleuca TaxID=29856 RepID=A0A0B7KIC0_BIOOC|nr:unnamed protein product [Clonostachys rosea f. rosea IK726]